jgi:hypothetical protein
MRDMRDTKYNMLIYMDFSRNRKHSVLRHRNIHGTGGVTN